MRAAPEDMTVYIMIAIFGILLAVEIYLCTALSANR